MFCFHQKRQLRNWLVVTLTHVSSGLQPEYRGQRKIKVTVCNDLIKLSGDVFATYSSIYGGMEQVTQIKSPNGTVYSDYELIMNLDRGGFHAIPHSIKYRDQAMMVIIEGRRPLCWFCKQLGHFSCSCPSKATTTATMTIKPIESITINVTQTRDHPNREEGWTQVTRGKKISPKEISRRYNRNNHRREKQEITKQIIPQLRM